MGKGYAVIVNGKIDVSTISETERSAKVNWLVANRKCFIYNGDTDERINELWDIYSEEAIVEEVSIMRN